MVFAADSMLVLGDATFRGGNSTGQLINGVLEVRGSFAQSDSAQAFVASGSHQTWFTGPANQAIGFTHSGMGTTASHFGQLTVAKTDGTLILQSDVHAEGSFVAPDTADAALARPLH